MWTVRDKRGTFCPHWGGIGGGAKATLVLTNVGLAVELSIPGHYEHNERQGPLNTSAVVSDCFPISLAF